MSSILEEIETKIAGLKTSTTKSNVGVVRETGDGVARIEGLSDVMLNEMIEFPNGVFGLALNLEETEVGAILMGDNTLVKEGDEAKTTGRLLSVPVGKALLGRVVNTLGQPLDGKGPIKTETFYPLEKIAPGVIKRRSVNQPVQTGIMPIDTMIPIGRGQRELIIGDRATGKTTIAIDSIISQARLNKAAEDAGDKNYRPLYCIYVAVGQKNSNVARVLGVLEKEGAMAGQIAPKNLFDLRPDLKALMLLGKLKERNAESIFAAIADELAKVDIDLLPATTFLEDLLAQSGLIAGPKLSPRQEQDVDLGWNVAKEMARLDIGQTIIVKNGTIVAVEALEGTNEAIKRGGTLAREGATMRIDRYTQKMQEALQAAQDLASQLNNSEITNEHFLSALLGQSDGIARPLLEKIGANVDQLQERLRTELERRPKIHGRSADLRIANELRTVLDSAEKEMSKLKDEFTSGEHYLLALAGVPQSGIPAAKLLKDLGVTRDKLMSIRQRLFIALTLLVWIAPAHAEPRLPTLFSDHGP